MKYLSLFTGIGGLYESGMSQVEIAQHYNVSQPFICRLMKNLGIKARVAKKRNQFGKNNDSWKGKDAGYAALHYRVYNAKGKPSKCDECGYDKDDRRYQWASLTGNFADINDYKRMCESCHAKYDKKIKNITK